MSQININTPVPPPPPPRMPSRAPIYVFLGLVAVLLLGGLGVYAARRAGTGTAQPTPTAAARAVVGEPTATVQAATGGPTATGQAGGATATATGGGGTTGPGPTPTSATTGQLPTNPTSLRVSSGSCTVRRIVWTWSGAQRATSYDLVLYDPVHGGTVKNATTSATSYTLGAGPGATVALKLRSRNGVGTAPNYYTPGGVGHVPPAIINPTRVTATTTGHTINWAWSAVPRATAYDLVLYHYDGSTPHTDIATRVGQAHWSTPVTPGVTYHLKVHSVGQCAPSTYYIGSISALVGATPTPGTH